MTNIVWLKRDLRTQDHEPFKLASDGVNNIFPIYIFDPEIIKKKDFSNRHFQFIYNSILDINETLKVKRIDTSLHSRNALNEGQCIFNL